MSTMKGTVKESEKPQKAPKKCKYGAKCNKKNCKFIHPLKPPTVDAAATRPEVPNQHTQNATNSKACRFGVHCHNKNCKFIHPTAECEEQQVITAVALGVPPRQEVTSTAEPSNTGDSESKRTKKDRKKRSVKAVTPDHSLETEEPSKSEPAEGGATTQVAAKPKQPPSKSQATNKPLRFCRFGERCHNPKCNFLHPQRHSTTAPPENSAQRIASPEIPWAAELEEALVKEAKQKKISRLEPAEPAIQQPLKQQQQQKIIDENAAKIREQEQMAADEEFARQLQKEEQELDQLLREQELQRLADVEKLVQQQSSKNTQQLQKSKSQEKKGGKNAVQEQPSSNEVERLEQQRRSPEEAKRNVPSVEQDKPIREVARKQTKEEEERLRFEEEEQARYKAARKAAKKERRRLEKEAKERMQQPSPTAESLGSNRENKDPFQDVPVPKEVVNETEASDEKRDVSMPKEIVNEAGGSEDEKKRRWQEELRLQKQRAKEKKEQQKKKRQEQYLKEQEELQRQTDQRAQFWKDTIADEKRTVALLVKLCVADFCRVHKIFDQRVILQDDDASAKLEKECQVAFRDLYKDFLPLRVVVKGLTKRQELNDRIGVIAHWDESKGKYQVEIETKKGKQQQTMFFPPGNLEALPNPVGRKGYKKRSSDPVHVITIPKLYKDLDLTNDIYKNEVDRLKKADSADSFLATLMTERSEEERLEKEREEEERQKEEEARRRRKAKREEEQREWEERQREYQRQKKEYKAYRRERQRASHSRSSRYSHFSTGCHCPECMFERMFFDYMNARMGGGRGGFSGSGFPFFFGGGPFFEGFDRDDDDYDYEDEWDRQWNRMHEEEEAEKDQEAADLLGVSVDATEAEIKRVFRRKALKYHPDKYKSENHEDGMTQEEAEKHFKELNNAVDHLMAKFD